MRLSAPFFRFDVNDGYAIVALGPIGFISINTTPGYFYPWGSFCAWLDLPHGTYELNLEDPLFGPRGPLPAKLIEFYPNE
jgi:hypothetical protein